VYLLVVGSSVRSVCSDSIVFSWCFFLLWEYEIELMSWVHPFFFGWEIIFSDDFYGSKVFFCKPETHVAAVVESDAVIMCFFSCFIVEICCIVEEIDWSVVYAVLGDISEHSGEYISDVFEFDPGVHGLCFVYRVFIIPFDVF